MPKLTVDGKTIEVKTGTRLVLAIEKSSINIGHRCGGNAQCTTCQVKFISGEPETMTEAEFEILNSRELYRKVRLSCQIEVSHDMVVKSVLTLENNPAWEGDTGPAPDTGVKPEASFIQISELETR